MTATRPQHLLAALLALAAAVVYAVVSLVRFDRFTIASFDNAIFEQAVKSYAGWGAPIVDIKGPGFNILGDHFSPVTALIAPFYRLFPSAQTILLAQVVLIAVSVYVIAVLGMRTLGTVTGVAIGVAYALSFGIQSAVEADFHEVAFAAPLLALAGAAYVDRRFGRVVMWSVPLLLVKEDMGLTVAMIGAVLWLAGERRRGTALAAGAIAAMALVLLVIVPAFNAGGSYAYSGTLGGDRGIVATLLEASDRKLATVVLTLAITGLAALASPWVLVVLPTFAWRFAGDVPFYWGTEWHYSLVLMPIVFVAMIDAIRRRPLLRWATPVGLVVGAFMLVSSPVAALIEPATYREPPRADAARLVLSLVPDGASVEADIGLMGHLVTDHTVYWLGTIGSARPDYVLFDLDAGIGSPTDVKAYAEQAHGGTYDVIFDRDGYVLAQRR
ncbi:DUF2079 domain-containing protein [Aeromicrobium fastidiosum]|uniref:DUF2079 domain-containing protein n=1 Tax=Aeromicrobium fastidiosum TaxID=52699 RepID=A0A641ALL9_9ACTN|nr:DUF2079 domain-containing protein [Aeromicrobium fastidiosum]KAA1378188.1 DUF2079 domain-containing protein [Aeromicrobium fastidiosum]MBP2389004.1 putative membrane protein [Aeromicrobium fastidiosum]